MDSYISSFFDLNAWQEARKLTQVVYKRTALFPIEERFGLSSQMKRASVSGMANIAEGFGRISIKEKLNFYNQAFGSLTELQSHSIIAEDLGFISNEENKELLSKIQTSQGLVQGLIRSTRKRLITTNEKGRG